MPSSRKPPDPPPTFFLDRGLGRRFVHDAIAQRGFEVVLLGDHYPDDGRNISDDVWIDEASTRGWLALTKDLALVRDHAAALESSSLRMFALPSANMSGPQMAERVARNLNRILQRARRPGPYVYVVHPKRLELRWPR